MIGFGRYNLLFKLAGGGMGELYLARQITLRRFCALKLIHPHLSEDKEIAERFLNEARSAASISHPNLASIYDCDQFDGQYFIAMEFIEGMTLNKIIGVCGRLPLPMALIWLKQAALALECLHGKQIIHRDIKPDNIMIDAEGVLKLLDLGLAKYHFEADQGVTSTGAVMGSPFFMSPEQINDSKAVDHRTDLYSLGIVLYHMLVGQVPFPQSSAAAVMMAHLNTPIPSISNSRPDITQPIDALVGKLTAKNRDERIQSVADLIAELQPWLANHPLDDGTRQVWSEFNFKECKVKYLLEKNKVDVTRIDSDLGKIVRKSGVFTHLLWPALSLLTLFTTGVGLFFLVIKREAPEVPSTRPGGPLAHAKLGGLHVTTQPTHADVMFKAMAKTSPAAFGQVVIGRHRVKVSLSGYQEIEREVEIEEGKFTDLNLTLVRIPGFLTITSDPPGAQIFVNDRRVGQTPYKFQGAAEETVECRLHLDGFHDKMIKAPLSETDSARLERLEPLSRPRNTAVERPAVAMSAADKNRFLSDVLPLFVLALLDDDQRLELIQRAQGGEALGSLVRQATGNSLGNEQQQALVRMKNQAVELTLQGLQPNEAADQIFADIFRFNPDEKRRLDERINQFRMVRSKQRVEREFRGFKVTGVNTVGGVSTAIINNQIVEEGKTYYFKGGDSPVEFKVIHIENDKITLKQGDVVETIPVSDVTMDAFRER